MKNLFDVKDKVVLITGGTSGLGLQFVKMFLDQGAKVSVVDLFAENLADTKEHCEKEGFEILTFACDVTDEVAVEAAVAGTVDAYGRIDILINNAGIGVGGNLEDMSVDEFRRVIDVNLNGVFIVAQAVGKVMIKQNYGKIVNLGSLHSQVGMNADVSQVTAYASSKGAVKMFTKSLAAEWAKYNITVNAIGPAYFASKMTEAAIEDEGFLGFIGSRVPMKRVGQPGELDGAVLFFSSDASSYTTGQTLLIDGGWTAV